MDWGTLIVQVTALIGAIAALIAIVNGIYELRERRLKRAKASEVHITKDSPPPSLPTQVDLDPASSPPKPLSNLPIAPTTLVGRQEELADLEALLRRPDVHLATLIGPAGIGKTRLALQLATRLLADYRDGVFFVALAYVADPDLVVPTIAQVLDVREQGDRPALDLLRDHLHEKQMLLVLDNFEQVIVAAPVVAALISSAPNLKILVTSREVLRLSAEHTYLVPPLALPDLEQLPAGEEQASSLLEYPALQLFVERARAVNPDFELTPENAAAVAEICYRLDGVPLAIELAAARVRLLTPRVMLDRLVAATSGPSLSLLTGGARDLPPRQQTLRNTIAWSYDLLDPAEQALFQRLAVFGGGWTLEAADVVCRTPGDTGVAILDGLESLIAKSLVRQLGPPGEGRFSMLRTIREYGGERLEQSGLAEPVRQAYADWYLAFSGRAEPYLYTGAQGDWLKRLDAEQDNFRAVMRWALENARPEAALRLAGNLAWYWNLRGRVSEGRSWLEAGLAAESQSSPETRAKGLLGLGGLVSNQGDWPAAWAATEESVTIARTSGDRKLLAQALATLALFKVRGGRVDGADTGPLASESLELARALGEPWTLGYVLSVLYVRSLLLGESEPETALGEEALRCFEKTGDQWGIILTLRHLSMGAVARGDYATARATGERGLEASRALGDRLGQAYTLNALGDITRMEGDYAAALAYYEQSLTLYRELGLKADIPASLHNLGSLALAGGDIAKAKSLQTESLELHMQAGNKVGMVQALSGMAAVSRASGEPTQAARLFGAAEALGAALKAPVWPAERAEYEHQVSILRRELDEATLANAWAEGNTMTLEQAVDEVLAARPPGIVPSNQRSTSP